MKKGLYFVDLDDTLISTRHLVVAYMNHRYQIKTMEEDLKDNNSFHLVVNKFRPEHTTTYNDVYLDFARNFFPFFRPEDFCLFDGAREAIQKMYEKNCLFITTTRQDIEKEEIKKILRYHEILHFFSDIHCVWRWENNKFVSIPKVSFINSLPGVKVGQIDDSLFEIKESVGNVLYPILFDPERKYVGETAGFEIVSHWKQIQDEYSTRKIMVNTL